MHYFLYNRILFRKGHCYDTSKNTVFKGQSRLVPFIVLYCLIFNSSRGSWEECQHYYPQSLVILKIFNNQYDLGPTIAQKWNKSLMPPAEPHMKPLVAESWGSGRKSKKRGSLEWLQQTIQKDSNISIKGMADPVCTRCRSALPTLAKQENKKKKQKCFFQDYKPVNGRT